MRRRDGSRQAALWLSVYALGYTVSPAFPLFVVPLAAIGNVLPLPGGVGGVETATIGLLAATTGIPIAVATGATFTDVAYLVRNTI